MKKSLTMTLCLLVGVGFYGFVQAGDLEPTGPPGPTMKTLEEVEPRTPISAAMKITSPGSYYLVEPLDVTSNLFRIEADNVTLDLNGFSLTGSSNYGLIIDDGSSNIVVQNGGMHGFAFGGLAVSAATNVHVRNMSFRGNDHGIDIVLAAGEIVENLIIEDCTIVENTDHGILGSLRDGSSVYIMNNVVSRNGGDGLLLSTSAGGAYYGSVTGNRFFANGNRGIIAVGGVATSLEFTKNVCGHNAVLDYVGVPNVSGSAGAGAWDNISLP